MKRIIFIAFPSIFIIIAFTGCTQKYGIAKAHAFSRSTTAGIISVDDNNKPTSPGVQTNNIIYVETDPNRPMPLWETAWVNGSAFGIEAVEVKDNEVNLGPLRNEEKEIVLTAKEGNQLWRLMLTPKEAQADPVLKQELEKNAVVITGQWKGKPFNYRIPEQKQLSKVFGE